MSVSISVFVVHTVQLLCVWRVVYAGMMTIGALRLGFFFIYLCLAVAAAVCDVRTNRCPNGVALALALTLAALLGFSISERACLHRLVFAAVLLLLLVAFELLWRRVKGRSGFGMGDIKVFFSMLLIHPLCAFVALGVACLFLCLFCWARSCKHAPFLPFLVPSFVVALILFESCALIL